MRGAVAQVEAAPKCAQAIAETCNLRERERSQRQFLGITRRFGMVLRMQ